jgi:hypothetical protein
VDFRLVLVVVAALELAPAGAENSSEKAVRLVQKMQVGHTFMWENS